MRKNLATYANKIFPGIKFSMDRADKALYLTFDDGPHPESTPRLLELLAKHSAKATFFCLGQNVEKYPAVYDSIIAGGHATGNHSWSHPNGWLTNSSKYLDNVQKASEVISSNLFRPPYGRITPGQYLQLRKKYKIIMWTRQFADYRPGFRAGRVSLNRVSPGDILVMHDSIKSSSGTLKILKRLLELPSHTPSIEAYNAFSNDQPVKIPD